MESATQDGKGKILPRDFVANSMIELHDTAVVNKKWGKLNFIVEFKDGVPYGIERYFAERLTAKSVK